MKAAPQIESRIPPSVDQMTKRSEAVASALGGSSTAAALHDDPTSIKPQRQDAGSIEFGAGIEADGLTSNSPPPSLFTHVPALDRGWPAKARIHSGWPIASFAASIASPPSINSPGTASQQERLAVREESQSDSRKTSMWRWVTGLQLNTKAMDCCSPVDGLRRMCTRTGSGGGKRAPGLSSMRRPTSCPGRDPHILTSSGFSAGSPAMARATLRGLNPWVYWADGATPSR